MNTVLYQALFLMFPTLAYAQDATWVNDLIWSVDFFIFDLAEVFFIPLALILFIIGIVKFIFNSGEEKAVEEGKKYMVWGIVALFVMVSVWGLVNILQAISGAGSAAPPNGPQVENPF